MLIIRDVRVQIPHRETGYPDGSFRSFPHSLLTNSGIVPVAITKMPTFTDSDYAGTYFLPFSCDRISLTALRGYQRQHSDQRLLYQRVFII
jgi:hypothetical protein